MRTLIFFLLISVCRIGYSQTDSLILFTKAGCSNCKATKLQLHQNKIGFKEYSLESDANGQRMLQILARAGYKERIYLPVILLNNKLCHPAYQNENGLTSIALPDVVDTLVNRQKRGAIHLPTESVTRTPEVEPNSTHSAACEVNASTFYLINSESTTELAAKEEMTQLIKSGYLYAGYLFNKGKYQVYSKFFLDKTIAESELERLHSIQKNAYLIEVK